MLRRGRNEAARSDVFCLAPVPPHGDEEGQCAGDQGRVVHVLRRRRRGIREGKNDNEDNDVETTDQVDGHACETAHAEPTWRQVSTTGEQMREDGHEVRQRGQLHVAADERVERRAGANVHAAHQRADDAAKHRGMERVLEPRADSGEEGAKRSGVVAGQGPEHPPRYDIIADVRQESGNEGDNQETEGAATRAGRLPIHLSKRKRALRTHAGQVRGPIENGD